MRISDWSSDVCSSDLAARRERGEDDDGAQSRNARRLRHAGRMRDDRAGVGADRYQTPLAGGGARRWQPRLRGPGAGVDPPGRRGRTERAALQWLEIGRASCRERVCKTVSLEVVAVAFKKNK